MATLSQGRKDELAKELEKVATWVQGPRRAKVLAIAEELRGTDPDEIDDKVADRLRRPGGGEVRTPADGEDPAPPDPS